jgi:hypothetical protein
VHDAPGAARIENWRGGTSVCCKVGSQHRQRIPAEARRDRHKREPNTRPESYLLRDSEAAGRLSGRGRTHENITGKWGPLTRSLGARLK